MYSNHDSLVADNNHNQHCVPSSNNGGGADNNDTGMGLRAASHVSMENTVDAHEYNPTCPCNDCAVLLHQFTQHDLLDAFVGSHLAYEARVESAYGFMPCVGGPHGNVVTRTVGADPRTGEPLVVREPFRALFFHYHAHEMRPVPAEIRHRSYARFLDAHNRGASNEHQQPYNNNNSGSSSAATTPSSYATRHSNTGNRRTFNNNNNGNHYQQQPVHSTAAAAAFASHATSSKVQRFVPTADAAAAAHCHYNGNNNARGTPFFYTPRDVEMAAQSVVFTGAARLGA